MASGEELAARRVQFGVLQAVLARKMNRHQSSVLRLERRASIGDRLALRYLDALDACLADAEMAQAEAGYALVAAGVEVLSGTPQR